MKNIAVFTVIQYQREFFLSPCLLSCLWKSKVSIFLFSLVKKKDLPQHFLRH